MAAPLAANALEEIGMTVDVQDRVEFVRTEYVDFRNEILVPKFVPGST